MNKFFIGPFFTAQPYESMMSLNFNLKYEDVHGVVHRFHRARKTRVFIRQDGVKMSKYKVAKDYEYRGRINK